MIVLPHLPLYKALPARWFRYRAHGNSVIGQVWGPVWLRLSVERSPGKAEAIAKTLDGVYGDGGVDLDRPGKV